MPELDDVQIDQPTPPGGPPGDGDRGDRKRSAAVWIIVLVVVIALGAGGYYLYTSRRQAAEPEVEEVTQPPEAAPEREARQGAEPEEEEIELPELSASDEVVRRVVQELSEHPALASWLATDGLVRRFVLAIDNIAVGLSPRKQLPFMAPEGEFSVVERQGGNVTTAQAAYSRYDRMAAVVASIDAEGAVATYERLKPLVDEASAELGYGPGGFDERLAQAIIHLLEAPIPAVPPELERETVSYHYADPRLENLTSAQKQLIRMGPENQRIVQAKLRRIALELGIPEERLPAER
jgi:hypothetical protein